MPQAHYVVDLAEGRWTVRIGEKTFTYSSQDAAVAAAMGAARKAEDQGFEVTVTVERREADAA